MAQLDGSLQRLVLLDAFLKAQVGELRGSRGGEDTGLRREGRSTWDPACKVFIGGLKSSMGRLQLKEVFSKFGSVRNCWVAKKPGGFGFVEMGSVRGAERAVKSLDGTLIWGKQVRVAMSQAKESQDGKETKKSETGKTTAGGGFGHLDSIREYQRRDDRSRDGWSEENRRKGQRRSSEDRCSKYDRKISLGRERTRKHKEREEIVKKDVTSPTKTCTNQCKSGQTTKVTFVTGRKKSTRSEDSKDLESSLGSRIKTDVNEEIARWDNKKKEDNWTSEDKEKARKRVPSSSSSSSSSSSNSSDWEAPWERIENDEAKKRKTT